jgi:hypothetical protein
VFGIESYYRNQLAGPLWVEGVDIERTRSRGASTPGATTRTALHERRAARFTEIVDFDAEAEQIQALFAQV